MCKMNFPTLRQKCILECISMTTAFVLENENLTDEFKLERGL